MGFGKGTPNHVSQTSSTLRTVIFRKYLEIAFLRCNDAT